MTKKHFIALAQVIRYHNQHLCSNKTGFDAGHLSTLADFCQSQNPRFNRSRWWAYIAGECGPNGGRV